MVFRAEVAKARTTQLVSEIFSLLATTWFRPILVSPTTKMTLLIAAIRPPMLSPCPILSSALRGAISRPH